MLAVLIINADDWGMDRRTTDNSLACFRSGGITSVSAMVFMADSERAAGLAAAWRLDTGLHLNLTQRFDGEQVPAGIAERQERIVRILGKDRFRSYRYHPLLQAEIASLFRAQYDEFLRLYRREPSHVDGHHHMHLCPNVLVGRLIPTGMRVRRSFTFAAGERSLLNRLYRQGVDLFVTARHYCTDEFYAIPPAGKEERLKEIVGRARERNIEIMVHPGRQDEYSFLTSSGYLESIGKAVRIPYALL